MGMAATRSEARVSGAAPICFESHEGLHHGGVLFLIPALLTQGLLKTQSFYKLPSSHYYQLESVVLTLAIMVLCRIKNPEQLKQCKVGELGKLIGLDRIPEMKCLRKKIRLLSEAGQSMALNNALIDHWYAGEDPSVFLYVDGHTSIYHGHKANIPAKFISRQKLCLSATAEFWVNDKEGLPLMVVSGELNEKLQEMIVEKIIPQLKETQLLKAQQIEADQPRCVLVFDREAYKPKLFNQLWEQERIAVITYRKNVTDKWKEESFSKVEIEHNETNITMHLCEQKIMLSGYSFREIRRLSDNGHQTAIITTHPTLGIEEVAVRMFSRWQQENFFKYMIADYNFDAMVDYGIEDIEQTKEVVNPLYRKLTNQIKKEKEKKGRLQAKLYQQMEKTMDLKLDQLPPLTTKQAELVSQIQQYEKKINSLTEERKSTKPRITIQQMPQDQRYNKLKPESKMLLNVIKMICYRAESALSTLMPNTLKGEKRMCIKQMILNNADITPDYQNKTLTVTLHAMTANRYNQAIDQITQLLNQTQTCFPNTDLLMVFKTTPHKNSTNNADS